MLTSSIVYGPISSRRLGCSLGINLMPLEHKLCTFNCVYCECGWNQPAHYPIMPSREQVYAALEGRLKDLKESPDTITFSGNGEPTLHRHFVEIIRDTCLLRDKYCPDTKITVLSNSTQLGRETVRTALNMCDNRVFKLDSAINKTMHLIDQPTNANLTVERIKTWLSLWQGNFILQTCFLRGLYNNQIIDNTTLEERDAWYKLVDEVHPKQIMIYAIDRETPLKTLEKVPSQVLDEIAAPLRLKGYDVIVSA